nr:uncharacterized protein LOC106685707 [Halyomorpha halys]
MWFFIVPLLHLCLTGFSMSASFPEDSDLEVNNKFIDIRRVFKRFHTIYPVLGPRICRMLNIVRNIWQNFKPDKAMKTPGFGGMLDILEPNDFQKQCLEWTNDACTVMNSTGIDFSERLKMVLNLKKKLIDLVRKF